VFLSSAADSSAQSSAETRALGDVARELRKQPQSNDAVLRSSPVRIEQATAVVVDPPELGRFDDEVKSLLLREDFAALDKLADTVRSSKARFPGGGWKLTYLYEALSTMPSASAASEADWEDRLGLLRRWTAARPESITARVCLAKVYLSYAWAARGDGYANTVNNQGWQLFHERVRQAGKELMMATTLKAKCPEWYQIMQQVALAEGADKDQLRAIFEKAIEYEPLYFAYYQRYAFALLPKWAGEPGDTEAFAEESYRKVGGKEGAHLYFEIAANLCGRCGDFDSAGYSWAKLKEGFAATEQLYGISQLKLNRFAYMAATYGDREVAAKTFARIGPHYDVSVWGSRGRFESQRTWAGLPARADAPATGQKSPTNPSPNMRISELLQLASRAAAEKRWRDSRQLAEQAIATAKSLHSTAAELGTGYFLLRIA
jgi:hypothetical protein